MWIRINPRWGGGGGTLIFSYILNTISGHIFGFQILKFYFFGVFQKNDNFFGYEDFVDIFLGSSQNWTLFSGHSYAFRVFS